MQTRSCRHGHADTVMQTRACRHGHADTVMQTRACRHGHAATAGKQQRVCMQTPNLLKLDNDRAAVPINENFLQVSIILIQEKLYFNRN